MTRSATPRPILHWPDPRLRTRALEITHFCPAVAALADEMLQVMYAASGRGLAGPQIGEMHRIFVMDCSWKEGAPVPRVMINPVILGSEGSLLRDEGCLSAPGLTVPVSRPARVRLGWQDIDGSARQRWFDGFEATCIQHERDHLDGIMHFDRAEPAVRDSLRPALAQLEQKARP